MNPGFASGDMVVVIPYGSQKVLRGDVVVFSPPNGGAPVVHRVVSASPQEIRTRGDNNREIDPWTLQPSDITGKVVAVFRQDKRREVYGGIAGVLAGLSGRIRLFSRAVFSLLLRPLHNRFSGKVFPAWLGRQLSLRVLSFERPAGTELQLLLGRRLIGRLPVGSEDWLIKQPYRLFVDADRFPRPARQNADQELKE